jgi:type IV secretion system protein VirB10
MSKDGSPDGLDVKTAPRTGYLGGAISRKLLAIIGIGLFVLVVFVLYIISQKGQRSAQAPEDPSAVEQSRDQSNGGLLDILSSAPETAYVQNEKPASPSVPQSPTPAPKTPPQPAPRNNVPPTLPGETEQERLARLAYEQDVEQIRQRKAQQLQTALSAKSGINIDLQDEKSQGESSASSGSSSVPALTAANTYAERPAEDPNKQDVKIAFTQEAHSNTYLLNGRETPLSPHELKVGTLIPATMISGLNSDLPGQIIASVSQNVYDSATGSHVLIPQGSRLYGTYDSQIAYGQDRILVAWTRVNYPDGTTLELKGMGAVDAGGFAGFEDQVNHHYWKIFGNAFILGMITGATEAGISDDDDDDTSTAEAVNNGVTQQFAETGSTLIEKNLDVQPTIIIRNGYKFNIMLNKDVVLQPYQPVE